MNDAELEHVRAALASCANVISYTLCRQVTKANPSAELHRLFTRVQAAVVLVDRALTNQGVLAMSQAPAPAAAPAFPEIDLDSSGVPTTFHKAVLTIATRQDGSPWVDQVTTYHHTTNAVVSILTGNIAALGSKMGPKGTRPKNQQFDVAIKLEVDGALVTNPPAEWNGVSREFILGAERELLQMWMHMNEDSMKAAKAHGKI